MNGGPNIGEEGLDMGEGGTQDGLRGPDSGREGT